MLWSKQFFFFDVDKWLTNTATTPMKGADASCGTRMVPHGEPARHLDARQMGVSVVCRLGSGFSHHRALYVDTDFAKEQLDLMLQEFSFIRPVKSRPTSGTSAT
jgi:hypothetical protein